MNEIQRYVLTTGVNPISGARETYRHAFANGEYVLHCDHLAKVEQTRDVIKEVLGIEMLEDGENTLEVALIALRQKWNIRDEWEEQAKERVKNLMAKVEQLEKENTRLKQIETHYDVLRGELCEVDGDGPCGICIKCVRAQRDSLKEENERLNRVHTCDLQINSAQFHEMTALKAQLAALQNRETAWLLDDGRMCVGSSCGHLKMVTYTDPNALRFSRKVDAENFAKSVIYSLLLPEKNCPKFTAVDHAWINAPQEEQHG